MKLFLKPNQNSAKRVQDAHSTDYGTIQYEMIDLCDQRGTVNSSVHVDTFWAPPEDPQYKTLYRPLRGGVAMMLILETGHALPALSLGADSLWHICDLLRQVGFATTNAEARRLIKQNAVSLDGEKITDIELLRRYATGQILKVGTKRIGWLRIEGDGHA